MSLEQELEDISLKLQQTIENSFRNELTGICYLVGHCMTEVLIRKGYEANKITGNLALLNHNAKKYIVYGKFKGYDLGDYHTWCEVLVNGRKTIVDPSLKYNRTILPSYPGNIKLNSTIPDILITPEKNTFYWKFIADETLESQSLNFLDKVPDETIENIISTTVAIS